MHRMIAAALVTLAFSATSQAAPIYKWVDAQGVTHFDAQPPAGQQTQQIDIKTPAAPSSSGNNNAQPRMDGQSEQRIIDTEVKKKIAQEEAKRNEDCKILRTNLSQLQNNPRVREQVEGGLRRLNEDERKARLAETEVAIQNNCTDPL
ncbi:glycosyltransferase [Paucimonas lemoignei]|nr:glycosyltransferase [Paucimonas lemoignei]